MIEAMLQSAPLCAGVIEIVELDPETFESIQQIATTENCSMEQTVTTLLKLAKNSGK